MHALLIQPQRVDDWNKGMSVTPIRSPACQEISLISGLSLIKAAPRAGVHTWGWQGSLCGTITHTVHWPQPTCQSTSQSRAQPVVIAIQQTIQDPGEYGNVIIGVLFSWCCWRLREAISCKRKETRQKLHQSQGTSRKLQEESLRASCPLPSHFTWSWFFPGDSSSVVRNCVSSWWGWMSSTDFPGDAPSSLPEGTV